MSDRVPGMVHQERIRKQNAKKQRLILDMMSTNYAGCAERYAASVESRDCERLQGDLDCELQGFEIDEMCEPCARYFSRL